MAEAGLTCRPGRTPPVPTRIEGKSRHSRGMPDLGWARVRPVLEPPAREPARSGIAELLAGYRSPLGDRDIAGVKIIAGVKFLG
jgi:hypothetical protein